MFTYLHALVSVVVGRLDIKSERGATAVEYGIMVALIAVVIIGVVFTLGGQLKTAFTNVTTELGKVTP